MKQATLTVIIAAKNEGQRIGDCVRSVAFADEILVLDSGSSDDTAVQARNAGAIVHATDWPGYGPQQQRGIRLASSDWVLSLDADERVSESLQQEILAATGQSHTDGYRIPRYSSFCGTFIEHSGWRPDYTLRLVRTKLAGFTDHFLHAHMTVDGSTANLHHPLIHYSYTDLDDVLEKLARYSKGAARDLHERGGSSSLLKAVMKGSWSFVRSYFLKQGFRDGRMGFVLAVYNSQVTYYKYLRLWMMGRNLVRASPSPSVAERQP
jgi:glycosyltransferase involved in cell wall biosynthesis